MKRLLIILALLAAAGIATLLHGIGEARRDPIVRTASLSLPNWPAGAAPVRVALISDVHIGSAAMDAARLARIVGQINALKPDLVLIAGDFIYGHEPDSAARVGAPMVAPLAQLKAPLGVIAVLGNHDHWTGGPATRALIEQAGIVVIDNGAVQRGPLEIGGMGDLYSRHADLRATLAAMRPLAGGRILLTHSLEITPDMPRDTLLLAGHTHCGQVVLPMYGPAVPVGAYGRRNGCGLGHYDGRTFVVTGGLGTSIIPVRLGAPPDLWLLTLGK